MSNQNYLDEVNHIDLKLRSKYPSAEEVRVLELEAQFTEMLKKQYPDAKSIKACVADYNYTEFGIDVPDYDEMMIVKTEGKIHYIPIDEITS
jgi:hypothetical protein